MKTFATAVAAIVALLAGVPTLAQTNLAGVSTLPPTMVTDATGKPSAAIPATAPTSDAPAAAAPSATTASSTADGYRPFTQTGGNSFIASATVTDDVNFGIVSHVVSQPNEIPDGTVVKVRLSQQLSTATTRVGTAFLAEVTEPVLKDGRVIIPAGSLLDGRVTMVRGGGRIGGPAALHLEPRMVTLANGSHYVLRARVIDTDRLGELRVDDEGTILRRDWNKKTLAALALTTGGSATAGAMIGGVPGALIGAGIGAGASGVVMLKQSHQEVLPKDTGVVFCLTVPMHTTPARDSAASEHSPMGLPGGE
jgi:hypothetical protein